MYIQTCIFHRSVYKFYALRTPVKDESDVWERKTRITEVSLWSTPLVKSSRLLFHITDCPSSCMVYLVHYLVAQTRVDPFIWGCNQTRPTRQHYCSTQAGDQLIGSYTSGSKSFWVIGARQGATLTSKEILCYFLGDHLSGKDPARPWHCRCLFVAAYSVILDLPQSWLIIKWCPFPYQQHEDIACDMHSYPRFWLKCAFKLRTWISLILEMLVNQTRCFNCSGVGWTCMSSCCVKYIW